MMDDGSGACNLKGKTVVEKTCTSQGGGGVEQEELEYDEHGNQIAEDDDDYDEDVVPVKSREEFKSAGSAMNIEGKLKQTHNRKVTPERDSNGIGFNEEDYLDRQI